MPHTPRPLSVVPPNASQIPDCASVLVSAHAVDAASTLAARIPHRRMAAPVAVRPGAELSARAWTRQSRALIVGQNRKAGETPMTTPTTITELRSTLLQVPWVKPPEAGLSIESKRDLYVLEIETQ